MAHQRVFPFGSQYGEFVEPDAHGYPMLVGQYGTDFVRPSMPSFAGCVQPPQPVHPEVAVQAGPVVEAEEEMLADGLDVEHCAASQVRGGHPRVPQFATHQWRTA